MERYFKEHSASLNHSLVLVSPGFLLINTLYFMEFYKADVYFDKYQFILLNF